MSRGSNRDRISSNGIFLLVLKEARACQAGNVSKGRRCQRGKRWKSGGKGMSGKSKLAGVVKEREISMRSRYLSLDRICSREFGSVLTSQVMAVLS